MKVTIQGKTKNVRTVWFEKGRVYLIDQPKLPWKFQIYTSRNYKTTADAITNMIVRGAPAIGATAAFGALQAMLEFKGEDLKKFKVHIDEASKYLKAARPTAIDLAHGVDRVVSEALKWDDLKTIKRVAEREAQAVADDYVEKCKKIGVHGAKLINQGANLLTHCNAGALATVDYGTATAPMYRAHAEGKNFFVFVDETRPRSQGARLTAWELAQAGIEHSVIADNAAGHFMQNGDVDLVLVGADRVARNGDVANKIGTYEKAVLAKENGIPFYVAIPRDTYAPETESGVDIPIEERAQEEVLATFSKMGRVRVANPTSVARNPAFDVTPAKYVKGYITEDGILTAKDLQTKWAH